MSFADDLRKNTTSKKSEAEIKRQSLEADADKLVAEFRENCKYLASQGIREQEMFMQDSFHDVICFGSNRFLFNTVDDGKFLRDRLRSCLAMDGYSSLVIELEPTFVGGVPAGRSWLTGRRKYKTEKDGYSLRIYAKW